MYLIIIITYCKKFNKTFFRSGSVIIPLNTYYNVYFIVLTRTAPPIFIKHITDLPTRIFFSVRIFFLYACPIIIKADTEPWALFHIPIPINKNLIFYKEQLPPSINVFTIIHIVFMCDRHNIFSLFPVIKIQ